MSRIQRAPARPRGGGRLRRQRRGGGARADPPRLSADADRGDRPAAGGARGRRDLRRRGARGRRHPQRDRSRRCTSARARCVAVAAGRDDTSILIVLTARCIARRGADQRRRVRADDNEALARQAGANSRDQPGELRRRCCSPARRMGRTSPSTWPTCCSDGRPGRDARARRSPRPRCGRPLAAIATGLGLRVIVGEPRPRALASRKARGSSRRHDPRDRAEGKDAAPARAERRRDRRPPWLARGRVLFSNRDSHLRRETLSKAGQPGAGHARAEVHRDPRARASTT